MHKKPIRLIIADIDGCLSRGSSFPYSPALVERLIEANHRSEFDSEYPAITFCTGRPQPYVECLIQVVHGRTPALCEGGNVLFDPSTHLVRVHPAFSEKEQRIVRELRSAIQRELISDKVMFEPGKITHHTLLVSPPLTPEALIEKARKIAAPFDDAIEVETTRVCVHFLLKELNKGTGVDWLSEYTGIELNQMAGIGDARPDLPFLKKLPVTFAPQDAHEDVKQVCTHVSGKCDAEATLELLDYIIKHNRSFSPSTAASTSSRR